MLQLILVQVITFVVLIIFLRFLFYRHLKFALERLKKLYQENLKKEMALNKELEITKQERIKIIEEANLQASRIKEEAKKKVEELRQITISKAKEEAKQILELAEKEAQRIKKEARKEIEEKSIEISCELIKTLFNTQEKKDLHNKFIEEILKELEKLGSEFLKIGDVRKVKITTALPLLPEYETNLKNILREKLGNEVEIEAKVDQEIIAGLIIDLEKFILDGSLKNRLKRGIDYLKGEIYV